MYSHASFIVHAAKIMLHVITSYDYLHSAYFFTLRLIVLVYNPVFFFSPNTPGLRDLQHRQELEKLLKGVMEARDNLPPQHRPPVLLKVAPDTSDTEKLHIALVAMNNKVSNCNNLC